MATLEQEKREEVLEYLAGVKAAVLSTHASDGTIDAAAVFLSLTRS